MLSRPALRLRGLYRVLLIVPWAVPSYVTALAWKGMFHKQFGAINAVSRRSSASSPSAWFARFSTAFAANVATNVWLGFPFMMVVALGALTAVPQEVLEAAEVDGATRWQRLRFVTLPLIAPTLHAGHRARRGVDLQHVQRRVPGLGRRARRNAPTFS